MPERFRPAAAIPEIVAEMMLEWSRSPQRCGGRSPGAIPIAAVTALLAWRHGRLRGA